MFEKGSIKVLRATTYNKGKNGCGTPANKTKSPKDYKKIVK